MPLVLAARLGRFHLTEGVDATEVLPERLARVPVVVCAPV